jgi:drug/metabolite transporter (DMT)-like permease
MFQFDTPKRKAYLYMHLSILLWGLTGVLGRGIQLQAGLLVWYRMLITVISMFVFILYKGQSLRISRTDLFKLIGIGTLLMIHWLFFYAAIKYSNVSIALTMLASQGLFTALIEPLVRKKNFKWDELIFSITAIIGIWLVFHVEQIYVTGIILGLLASFVGAFFNILNKDVVSRHSPVIVSFYEIAAGLLILTAALPFYIQYFHPGLADAIGARYIMYTCHIGALSGSPQGAKRIYPESLHQSRTCLYNSIGLFDIP